MAICRDQRFEKNVGWGRKVKRFKKYREYVSSVGLFKNSMFSKSPATNIEILKKMILPYFTVYFSIGASRLVVFPASWRGKPARRTPSGGLVVPLCTTTRLGSRVRPRFTYFPASLASLSHNVTPSIDIKYGPPKAVDREFI